MFSKILALATLKCLKSGTYYICSVAPTRTTGFDVNKDSLNDHHVSLDILTFKGATTGRIQGYQLRRPRTKQNEWLYLARA